MALIGNTADTYGQTWHLPCDDNRFTYKQFITEIGRNWANKLQSFAQGRPQNRFFFNHNLKETQNYYLVMRLIISLSPQNSKPDFRFRGNDLPRRN
jgi:hypothetical protein